MNWRAAAARELCELIDAAAQDRVMVYGSLPPQGTDIDLLVRPAEEAAVREALRGAGLAEQGARLARFGVGTALEVELQAVGGWELPAGELEALYAEASPLPGLQRVVEPAPHHRLLILAARTLAAGEPLSARRRARIDRALAEDHNAWREALRRAGLWGDPAAVERLRALHGGAGVTQADRLRWRLAQARRLGRRRGLVVALSGVDGAGKSFQATALEGAVRALGRPAAVEWIPLASNVLLSRLAAPLKRVLARFRALRPQPEGNTEQRRGLVPNPGSMLRERNPAVNYVWATLVAATNGASHAYRAWRHHSAGGVIIFDRYVLDSLARFRFFYGADRRLRLPRALIRALSPRPDLAFFLDVPAATSTARKDKDWHAEEIERQVGLYREEYERCDVVRLDGRRPADDLAREIAEAVWRRLR